MEPRRVGKYVLGAELGSGAFATVRLAADAKTGEKFAMKVLRRDVHPELAAKILVECQVMKVLQHPNIVQLKEVLATKKNVYMVLEFCPDGELYDVLADRGAMREKDARTFFHQLIDAIDFCHRRGVFHRDLKPENLLLASDGSVLKVADFGMANVRAQNGSKMLTTCVGSDHYCAPEIRTAYITDSSYDGSKADTWSCGVLLFVFLTGFLPFDDDDPGTLAGLIERCDVRYPKLISEGARDLLSHLLVRNPAERYTTTQIKAHPWFRKDFRPYRAPKTAGLQTGSNTSKPDSPPAHQERRSLESQSPRESGQKSSPQSRDSASDSVTDSRLSLPSSDDPRNSVPDPRDRHSLRDSMNMASGGRNPSSRTRARPVSIEEERSDFEPPSPSKKEGKSRTPRRQVGTERHSSLLERRKSLLERHAIAAAERRRSSLDKRSSGFLKDSLASVVRGDSRGGNRSSRSSLASDTRSSSEISKHLLKSNGSSPNHAPPSQSAEGFDLSSIEISERHRLDLKSTRDSGSFTMAREPASAKDLICAKMATPRKSKKSARLSPRGDSSPMDLNTEGDSFHESSEGLSEDGDKFWTRVRASRRVTGATQRPMTERKSFDRMPTRKSVDRGNHQRPLDKGMNRKGSRASDGRRSSVDSPFRKHVGRNTERKPETQRRSLDLTFRRSSEGTRRNHARESPDPARELFNIIAKRRNGEFDSDESRELRKYRHAENAGPPPINRSASRGRRNGGGLLGILGLNK